MTGATVNLTLAGSNVLKSGTNRAGLQVPEGATLTIGGNGSLEATGGKYGAGIGGGGSLIGFGGIGGTVTINGGTVTASGSICRAGIGGGGSLIGFGGIGGTVIIDGGAVIATDNRGSTGIGDGNSNTNSGTLKNKIGTDVVRYTFTLDGVTSPTAVTELLTTTALGYPYGTKDMKTDANGILCVYLPAGKTAARITTADRTYTGSIENNAGTLTPLPLTAAQYAAASPAAASGSDYVVDDTNKTLTIKTAKGAAFWSGSGTTYLAYTVKLANDIDVSAFLWTPVGNSSNNFTGTFDGQGHTIKGMTVNVSSRNAGLFAFTSNAKIRNVGLIDSSITCAAQSGGPSVGGIVGNASTSTVSNCYSSGNITASTDDRSDNALGGIIGFANGISVSNCYSNSRMSGTSKGGNTYSAGIVGFAADSASTVINCYYLKGSGMPDKGINAAPNVLTATSCGTFADNSGTLTAGTTEQFGGSEAQALAYGSNLFSALDGWVVAQTKPNDYQTWALKSGIHGGYPVFDTASATSFPITPSVSTNGSYTVKMGGREVTSAAVGETITINPNANSGYAVDTVTVKQTESPNAPVPVSNNAFTMPAYAVTVTVTFKAIGGGSSGGSGGGGGGGGSTTTTPTAPVIVGGKTENIGTSENTASETTVTVDSDKLNEKVNASQTGGSVQVPVSDSKAAATAGIVVKNVESMAKKNMTLEVKSGAVSYQMPTTAIDTAAVMTELGATDTSKVPLNVTIKKLDEGTVKVEDDKLIVPPVSFTITATYSGKTVEVKDFSQYVQRSIEITKEQAAQITTAVVKNEDSTLRHVPTYVYQKDGKWFATIHSRTNSTYALIHHEATFADAQGKYWVSGR